MRRQSIKRRPTASEAVDLARPVPGRAEAGSAPAGPAAEDASAGQREQLLAEFSASLDRRDDLDDESREFLLQQYRDAVESAPADLRLEVPDREQWIETVDALKANGLLSDEDSNDLIRSFDEAVEPLKSPEFRDALEFARRCRDDGEDAAFAWLETRKQEATESSRDHVVPAGGDPHPLGGVAERRVRRPRGPPSR